MAAGYIYFLTHPELPGATKIGRTVNSPKKRLHAHNTRGECGEVVKQTGKKWVLAHYVPVTDTAKAESAWWEIMAYPKFNNVEIMGMSLADAIDILLNDKDCSQFIDKARYEEMLQGELREYDITHILEEIEANRKARREQFEKFEKRRKAAKKAAETRRRNRLKSSSD